MVATEGQTAEDRLLRKAINLFTFLGRTQEMLVKPIRTVDRFEKAIWLGALPEPLLAVDRVPRLDPPQQLRPWIEGTTPWDVAWMVRWASGSSADFTGRPRVGLKYPTQGCRSKVAP